MAGNDVDVKDVSEDQKNDNSTDNGMWRRHERRILYDDSSSSSSSSSLSSSSVKDKSLLTNKSFADLEQLTSPDGLEKFLVETHRASLLPTAESPPQKKIIHVHSPPKKARPEKVSKKKRRKRQLPRRQEENSVAISMKGSPSTKTLRPKNGTTAAPPLKIRLVVCGETESINPVLVPWYSKNVIKSLTLNVYQCNVPS